MGNDHRGCPVMSSSGLQVLVDARSFSLLMFVTNQERQDPLFSAHFKIQRAQLKIILVCWEVGSCFSWGLLRGRDSLSRLAGGRLVSSTGVDGSSCPGGVLCGWPVFSRFVGFLAPRPGFDPGSLG